MVKQRPGSRKGKTKLGAASKKAARRQAAKQANGLASRRTIVHPVMRDAWDRRRSPANNLSSVGLSPSVNSIRKSRATTGRTIEVAPLPRVVQHPDVLEKLSDEANLPERPPNRVVHPGERLALKKMVERYGDDWERMARDLKLNYLQWTPRQLQRKVERMEAILKGKE